MPEHFKNAVDWAAGFITLATVVEALPQIAAGLTALWTILRFCEWFYRLIQKIRRKN